MFIWHFIIINTYAVSEPCDKLGSNERIGDDDIVSYDDGFFSQDKDRSMWFEQFVPMRTREDPSDESSSQPAPFKGGLQNSNSNIV